MIIEPPDRRSQMESLPTGTKITIPAQRNIIMVLFLIAWLVGWAFGEVSAIRGILSDDLGPDVLFTGVWLMGWTIGGGLAIYGLLWMLVGEEIIQIQSGLLSIKHDVLGFGKTKEFDLVRIRNLRFSPVDSGERSDDRKSNIHSGTIAFDYGAKTFRFGTEPDEAEASLLISDLKQRHQLHTTSSLPGYTESN